MFVVWWLRPLPATPDVTAPATVARPFQSQRKPALPPAHPVATVTTSRLAGTVSGPDATVLNEHTLVGTKWGHDGFNLEFGADGKLFIGGQERAQWQVQGSRIRLYRDDTGEEHWLDIVSNQLMWEGQELSPMNRSVGL